VFSTKRTLYSSIITTMAGILDFHNISAVKASKTFSNGIYKLFVHEYPLFLAISSDR
jgi:hypothetical protein